MLTPWPSAASGSAGFPGHGPRVPCSLSGRASHGLSYGAQPPRPAQPEGEI